MDYDLIVIGAGPAGMAAATEAAKQGLSVILLDEQLESGGQVYRSVASASEKRPEDMAILGPEYSRGLTLVDAMKASNIEYRPQASVWNIEPNLGQMASVVRYSSRGLAYSLSAKRILIATGAMERPVPIPGWTLTGVMGAGGAQILLKSTGMIPDGPTVLAGSGPLLLLTAAQLHSVGANIVAVLETTTWRHYLAGAKGAIQAMAAPEYLLKGLKMRHALGKAKIPIYSGIKDLQALGNADGRLDSVRFNVGAQQYDLPSSTLLLHEGVIPNTAVARLAGLIHEWCPLQQHWQPRVSSEGNTSMANIMVAGDGAGILGARAAEESGRITALNIARQLGKIDEVNYRRKVKKFRRTRWRHAMIRPLLDTLFAPTLSESISDGTTICRCYEVSKKSIADSVHRGCQTPNQVKALLRCGMGPCQGRMCSNSVANIIAETRNAPIEDIGVYRARPPIKPITVRELASMQTTQGHP